MIHDISHTYMVYIIIYLYGIYISSSYMSHVYIYNYIYTTYIYIIIFIDHICIQLYIAYTYSYERCAWSSAISWWWWWGVMPSDMTYNMNYIQPSNNMYSQSSVIHFQVFYTTVCAMSGCLKIWNTKILCVVRIQWTFLGYRWRCLWRT